VDKVPSARQKSERIAAVVAKRKEIPWQRLFNFSLFQHFIT
jgi:hypothetical protein